MVWRKAGLILPLLLALYLLKDESDDNQFAVHTALDRHPPAKRVFRALFEVSLILFGAALSVHIWVGAAGTYVVGQLLFKPVEDLVKNSSSPLGRYEQISTNDNDNDSDEEDSDDEQQVKHILSEEEAMDGDYASEGEVVDGPSWEEDDDDEDKPIAEPPSPAALATVAINLLLSVLISLFLFTLSSAKGGRYIEGDLSAFQILANIAAPLFPLLLFTGAFALVCIPWERRKSLWIIVATTIGAPFTDVTFRDGFVGDVLTSSVRPLQDISFTCFYILSGLSGWWTQIGDLDDAALPVERSWIVRTVVLPACMVSPLWWRFNQNLRQVYDSKQRWPYLGNATKYLAAAQVAMFGVFAGHRNPVWMTCAVTATLYQVWWDVCMDWDLIRFDSSGLRLRQQRLYPNKALYWTILIVNIVLRFSWTMTFLPHNFLDQTGVLKPTFEGMFFVYIDPVLASAEIVRRTLWGLIRLELEAITCFGDHPKIINQLKKCSDTDPNDGDDDNDGDLEMREMNAKPGAVPEFVSMKHPDLPISSIYLNDISGQSNMQILLELGLWTAAFSVGGLLAAYHRDTL